jgi:hypothetical protein
MTPVLTVTDSGDELCAARQWEVTFPFEMTYPSDYKLQLRWFKAQIKLAYREFAIGKITAHYDFETNETPCV